MIAIDEDIVFNFLLDCRKKDIDPITRAVLLRQYMVKTKTAQKALARQLGIPFGTLTNWLKWSKVSRDDLEHVKRRHPDLSDQDVFRHLGKRRGGRMTRKELNDFVDAEVIQAVKDYCYLDEILEKVINLLEPVFQEEELKTSDKTPENIKRIRTMLDRLE